AVAIAVRRPTEQIPTRAPGRLQCLSLCCVSIWYSKCRHSVCRGIADMYVIDSCLWITASVLCAAALVVGLCKKRVNSLPVFSCYLGYSALTNPVGFAIRTPWLFEWFVFSVTLAGFALELAVI